MKWIVWTLLLLAPLVAHAGDLEQSASEAFRDIQSQEHAEMWEYGGIIVSRFGVLFYSAIPQTNQKPDTVLVSPSDLLRPGDTLMGLYHTHPCMPGYWTGLYSVSDVIQQIYWKVPSFFLDQCTMKIHEFEFGVDHVQDTGRVVTAPNGKKLHLPAGRIVGDLWLKPKPDRLSKPS